MKGFKIIFTRIRTWEKGHENCEKNRKEVRRRGREEERGKRPNFTTMGGKKILNGYFPGGSLSNFNLQGKKLK